LAERIHDLGENVSETAQANEVVVIAEDYPDISQLVGDILRDEGFRVVAVARGAEVVPAVKRHRPSLLLLDLSLPDIPGNEVLRQLALSPETSDIPVIIVSAYTEQLRRVPQVQAVVNKPFDLTTLVEAVQAARKPRQARA
jgi:CheY-like chemotaxis protein